MKYLQKNIDLGEEIDSNSHGVIVLLQDLKKLKAGKQERVGRLPGQCL